MSTIITIPHHTLRQLAQPVTQADRKLERIIKDLTDTLVSTKAPKGVGLAAPQIDLSLACFATRVPDEKNRQHTPRVYINPRIVDHSDQKTLGGTPDEPFLEGCLSIPGIFGPVWRYHSIVLEYDLLHQGELVQHTEQLDDFAARVAQHELDHLQGVLFIDHCAASDLPIYQGAKRGDTLEELSAEMKQALLVSSRV